MTWPGDPLGRCFILVVPCPVGPYPPLPPPNPFIPPLGSERSKLARLGSARSLLLLRSHWVRLAATPAVPCRVSVYLTTPLILAFPPPALCRSLIVGSMVGTTAK